MLVCSSASPSTPHSPSQRTTLASLDVDYDPAKAARDARKARVAKNERQHQQNLSRAAQGAGTSGGSERKKAIDRTLAVTRSSTASMGKFDRQLEGEKKLKGVKRKVSSRGFVVDTPEMGRS